MKEINSEWNNNGKNITINEPFCISTQTAQLNADSAHSGMDSGNLISSFPKCTINEPFCNLESGHINADIKQCSISNNNSLQHEFYLLKDVLNEIIEFDR